MGASATTRSYDRVVLDLERIRSHFPAFDNGSEPRFFENAGGSFACRQTTDALNRFYTETKVQPYSKYQMSATAGELMDHSHERWAQALGVTNSEIVFGPSTSMNTYVLSHAFAERIGPGDEVIVTNQDHEANTGATRRMVESTGATLREWQVDPSFGLLGLDALEGLLSAKTKLVTFPHCSNIVGTENDVPAICQLARQAGARTIVDGVSYAPHGFSDVGAMGADVYLFSMYKTFSVHQGLMVLRDELAHELPNQSHYFNADVARKRMSPAGPDHAQVASAGAVLDYVEATTPNHEGDLRRACEAAKHAWQEHEDALLQPVLRWLDARADVRLIGATEAPAGLHRCPTVAFVAEHRSSAEIAAALVGAGVMASSGDFYATRLLQAVGVDPSTGVVRLSWVHYTSPGDIEFLLDALEQALS